MCFDTYSGALPVSHRLTGGFHDLTVHTDAPLERSDGQGWLSGTAKCYATRSRYRSGWGCSRDHHHCRRSPLAALGSQSAAACTARRWFMSHQEDPSGRKQCMPGPPPARMSGGGAGSVAPGAYWSLLTDGALTSGGWWPRLGALRWAFKVMYVSRESRGS